MPFYTGEIMQFLLNGQSVNCLSSFALSDSSDKVRFYEDDVEWSKSTVDLQGYQLSLSGYDEGSYTFLRALKRSKSVVSWSILSSDGYINLSGSASIISLSRSHNANGETTVGAELLGIGIYNSGVLISDKRLLEDGSTLLLEDDDKRLLENFVTSGTELGLEDGGLRLLQDDGQRLLENG